MPGTALILGANGRFGRHAAEAFWNAGWTVRIFDRATDDLMQTAAGADVIVNGWNPPYTQWAGMLPDLTRRVIDAAQAHNCSVIIPGNVYVFGASAPETFGPNTPHTATNPLGRLRIEMEAAYRASGVQTILLRVGDFIDTVPSGNWFDAVLTKRMTKGRLDYPGPTDAIHAWAYLPDLAQATEKLARKRDELDRWCEVEFPGYTLTGARLCELIEAATNRPVRLRQMSWLPLCLARPFWPMARHLIEMRYLWRKPHHLDDSRFTALLPGFRATPVEVALASALEHQINPDKPMAGGAGVAVAQ